MNWLKSLQKLTRLLVGFLGFLVVALTSLRSLAFLAALRSLAAVTALEKNGPRLILPPGTGLRDMLHAIYPPKTAERVFDQTIADVQLEWQEAMINDQKWLARWVRVRGAY